MGFGVTGDWDFREVVEETSVCIESRWYEYPSFVVKFHCEESQSPVPWRGIDLLTSPTITKTGHVIDLQTLSSLLRIAAHVAIPTPRVTSFAARPFSITLLTLPRHPSDHTHTVSDQSPAPAAVRTEPIAHQITQCLDADIGLGRFLGATRSAFHKG